MKKLLFSRYKLWIVFWGIVNLLVVACEPSKYAECSKLIALANDVTRQTEAIAKSSSDRDQELDNWLEASELKKQAASNIESLELKDQQLIEYQSSLINIYRVESQATYDAVKAKENRDLTALKLARDEVTKITDARDSLVTNINNYCINNP